MAAVVPFVQLGLGLITAVSTFSQARRTESAGQEARRHGELNAAAIERESNEEARRLRYQADREKSRARARYAASGVTMEGTPSLYLGEMEQVAQDEIDWLHTSSRSRQGAAIREGVSAERVAYSRASGQRSAAWSSMFGAAARFGEQHNWWQQ